MNWNPIKFIEDNFGPVTAVLVVTLLALWFLLDRYWGIIKRIPAVHRLIRVVRQKRIPKPPSTGFSIAVLCLANDQRNNYRRNLEVAIRKAAPSYVNLILVDREIDLVEPNLSAGHSQGHCIVRKLLKRYNYHAALWGEVLDRGENPHAVLNWTTLQPQREVRDSALYVQDPDSIELPKLFWEDLARVLVVIAFEQAGNTLSDEGFQDRGRLNSFNEMLRNLTSSIDIRLEASERAKLNLIRSHSLISEARLTAKISLVEESVNCCRDALGNLQNDSSEERIYVAKGHLANALLAGADLGGSRSNIEEAVSHYRDCEAWFEVQERNLDCARTRMNLATALGVIAATWGSSSYLDQAIAAFQRSLEDFTRQKMPFQWARIQYNLAGFLVEKGRRSHCAKHVERAIDGLRGALAIRRRECYPLLWANTKRTLGAALFASAELAQDDSESIRFLKEAEYEYSEALAIQTKTQAPFDRTRTQINLANVQRELGIRTKRLSYFDAADGTLKETSGECPRERVPLDWARIRNARGLIMVGRADVDRKVESLKLAVTYFKEAICAYDGADALWLAAETKINLANVMLRQSQDGAVDLRYVREKYEEAANFFEINNGRPQSAEARYGVGAASIRLAGVSGLAEDLEIGVAAAGEAARQFRNLGMIERWAAATANEATGLLALARKKNSGSIRKRAKRVCSEAIDQLDGTRVPALPTLLKIRDECSIY